MDDQPLVGTSMMLRKEDTGAEKWRYPSVTHSAYTVTKEALRDYNRWTGQFFIGGILSSFLAALIYGLAATLGALGFIFGPLGTVLNGAIQGFAIYFIFSVFPWKLAFNFNPFLAVSEIITLPHYVYEQGGRPLWAVGFLVAAAAAALGGQIVGSLIGGAVLPPGVLYNLPYPYFLQVYRPTGYVAGTFVIEMIGSFFLTWAYLHSKYERRPRKKHQLAQVMGITTAALVTVFGWVSGASFNPWRHLAPLLLTGATTITLDWVYYVGPLVGNFIGCLAWGYIYRQTRRPEIGAMYWTGASNEYARKNTGRANEGNTGMVEASR